MSWGEAARADEFGPEAESDLWVGLGRVELPRPDHGPLGGYGGFFDRRAEQVFDPPEVRALVLEQGSLRVALISIDLVIVRSMLRDDLVKRLGAFDMGAVVLTATHTHSGTGGYIPGWLPQRLTAGKFDPMIPRELVQRALQAIQLAIDDLLPARVRSGQAELDLARNRRHEEGPHERALPVLRFDFSQGRKPLILFAYGAHPTVLSPKSRGYSADYVGAARAWLEERGWRAFFLPGPLGDQEPTPVAGELWPGDVALQRIQVAQIGAKLGRAVEELAQDLNHEDPSVLEVVERWVDMPESPRLRRFCPAWWFSPFVASSLRGFFPLRVPFHALRIGNLRLVTTPAEPTSRLGSRIRKQLQPAQPVAVIAHSNDWIGYVLSEERYHRGGYEACMSFYGPKAGDWLVGEAVTTVGLLESRAP